MISEKDIADFKAIDCTKARAAVKTMIYFDIDEHQYEEALHLLTEFFKQIELIQNKAVKQIPALFKPISGEQ